MSIPGEQRDHCAQLVFVFDWAAQAAAGTLTGYMAAEEVTTHDVDETEISSFKPGSLVVQNQDTISLSSGSESR